MSIRASLAFAFACCALSKAVGAQRTQAETGRFLFAAGTEALGFRDGSVVDPALALQFGYERPVDNSRIALRLSGNLSRNSRNLPGGGTSERSYGVGLFSTYSLLPGGALQPYLIGGAGLERLRVTRTLQRLEGTTARSVSLVEQTSASVAAGGGLISRLGRVSVFAESRVTYFPGDYRLKRFTMPVLLGLRF